MKPAVRLPALLATLGLTALLPLALTGCPPGDDDDSSSATPSSTATAVQSALSIEFTGLTFTHTVGGSPCPQEIGTVTITNSTDASASVAALITGAQAAMFGVDPAKTTVPAGGTTTLTVVFNCAWDGTRDISGTISVTAGNGTKTNEQSAPITGTVLE